MAGKKVELPTTLTEEMKQELLKSPGIRQVYESMMERHDVIPARNYLAYQWLVRQHGSKEIRLKSKTVNQRTPYHKAK